MLSDNCFTWTCKRLIDTGVNLPLEFEGLHLINDHRAFIKNYKSFLSDKTHYRYFESFGEYVDKASKNDIIIDDHGVGIAINEFKYYGIFARDMKPRILDINKYKKIIRIK